MSGADLAFTLIDFIMATPLWWAGLLLAALLPWYIRYGHDFGRMLVEILSDLVGSTVGMVIFIAITALILQIAAI